MRKSKFRYILLVLLISIVLLIYLSLDKIRISLSMLDIYNKTKIVKQLEAIPNNKPIDELTDDKYSEKQISWVKDPGELGLEEIKKNNNILQVNRTIEDISTEYNVKFNLLQVELENEISRLIQAGITDYNSGVFSETNLADKYIAEGANLENIFDSKFNLLVSNLEKELKKNSYDTSIIKGIKKYYETFKTEKKAAIISKGMELGKGN